MIKDEGHPFTPETIRNATLDRVVPVLMTALVAALALIPLMLAGNEPGKELLNPLANVIFGGLMSSTIISLFLTPALLYLFAKPVFTNEPSRSDLYIRRLQRSSLDKLSASIATVKRRFKRN